MPVRYWKGCPKEWQRNVIIPPEEWGYLCQRAVDAKQPISRFLTMLLRNSNQQCVRRREAKRRKDVEETTNTDDNKHHKETT